MGSPSEKHADSQNSANCSSRLFENAGTEKPDTKSDDDTHKGIARKHELHAVNLFATLTRLENQNRYVQTSAYKAGKHAEQHCLHVMRGEAKKVF